jgi:hypothetical protein
VQKPSPQELRDALDAMRNGKPGEAAFDASLVRIPQLIDSDSGVFIEAGAYLAGEHRRAECVPALIERLRRENERHADNYYSAKRTVLDALLRLDAQVPIDVVLARPERDFVSQMYLLLVRNREHGRDGLTQLLDLRWIDTTAHWASACALVEARDPRIAACLISGWDWEFSVGVRDLKSNVELSWSGWGSVSCTAHEIWPPRTSYTLVLPTKEQPLQPIAFNRREAKTCMFSPHTVEPYERTELRARLLDRLLRDEPERTLAHESEDLFIEWREGASLDTPLRDRVSELRDRIGKMAVALRRIGLIDDRTVLPPLSFRVRIQDLRDNHAAPLPPPPSIDGVTYEEMH